MHEIQVKLILHLNVDHIPRLFHVFILTSYDKYKDMVIEQFFVLLINHQDK